MPGGRPRKTISKNPFGRRGETDPLCAKREHCAFADLFGACGMRRAVQNKTITEGNAQNVSLERKAEICAKNWLPEAKG